MKHLVLAGGVALNCVANGRLLREGPFDDIWIQPAAGDAGGALGAALFVWHQLLDKPRDAAAARTRSRGASSGRRPSERRDPRGSRPTSDVRHRGFDDEDELLEHVAAAAGRRQGRRLVPGRGWSSARGPGGRSILGDPRSPAMQATMNLKIKFRESFRPFARRASCGARPRVVRHAARARRAPTCSWSPRSWRSTGSDPGGRGAGSGAMAGPRPAPAGQRRPLDGPGGHPRRLRRRLQTVDAERNPRFHRLLATFHQLTGCPCS